MNRQRLELEPVEHSRASTHQALNNAELIDQLLAQQLALQQRFKQTLDDVLATLERTKHSFRSRELGELRKRLQSVQCALSEQEASATFSANALTQKESALPGRT